MEKDLRAGESCQGWRVDGRVPDQRTTCRPPGDSVVLCDAPLLSNQLLLVAYAVHTSCPALPEVLSCTAPRSLKRSRISLRVPQSQTPAPNATPEPNTRDRVKYMNLQSSYSVLLLSRLKSQIFGQASSASCAGSCSDLKPDRGQITCISFRQAGSFAVTTSTTLIKGTR